MKKYLFILLALAVALSFGAPVMAKQGLSVGLGLGLMPNCGNLGGTIVNDGLTQNADVGVAIDEVTLIEAEDSLLDQKDKGTISNLETNGAMNAMDIGLQVRYDLLGYLFVKTGFNYATKVMGGETTWKFGGVKQEQIWDYSHIAIPFTVGLNLPIAEGKFNVYLGLTAAYMSGGWSVDLTRSYVTSSAGTAGAGITGAITAFDGGKATEKAEFSVSGIGMGYVLGFDAEVIENLNVFIEVESLAMGDYNRHNITDPGLRAAGIYEFNYFTFVGGSFLRFGAKYNLGFATL